MNCARNIITANFSGGGTSATTAPLWQWDYGQVLCITGIDLPAAFEVHFSTNRAGGVSTVAVGADGQVTIPNVLLTIGKNLNAWIYLSDAQGEGETEYSITIPVKARPMPETYDAEVSGEFDDVVRQVSEYAQTAQTAADNAGASASAAATSASEAAASASAAETAKIAAQTAQGKAEDAQTAAETAAQTATQKAQQTAQDAAQAALDAGRAESAAGRAEAAETGAENAKTDAETAAQGAADSASAASASATSAGQAATSAAQSATAAAGSATTAQGAAQTATTKAGEASASADAAAASETAAQTAQQGAEAAKDTAVANATTATTKAAEAAQSASNAAQSKTDAEAAATRAETAAASLTVDSALSDTSTNPVQNKVITGEIADVKSAIDELDSAFDYTRNAIVLSAFVAGKYMATNGTLTDQVACQYATAEITEELVGKTLLISGSAWWDVKPYVFIASDSTIEYANIPYPGGTLTQYTDLEFEPQKTGTLYINKYASGSVVNVAKADYLSLSSIKDAYLPNDIGDNIFDALSYKPINLTMIEGKLLSGLTGAITDNENASYRVSDYIEVDGNSWYLVSTEHFWSSGLYAWYDENKVFISGLSANTGGTVTKFYCRKIKSPANARYLVIGFLYQPNYTYPFLMAGEMKSILPSKRWSGKKWACVGDSLTEAYSRTGAHYFDIISAVTGIEAINMGVSGTGYARGTDNFMTRALTVPTDSDVVTFFGSGNDSGAGLDLGTASDTGTDTLGGCINTAIDNLYSIMPVVQLGIVTPTPWQGNMPSDEGWMSRYSALIVEICNRRSIPCLDLFHCSNLNPNSAEVRAIAFARDDGGGVHPSEAGHTIIAPRFLAFLESLLMH